ncbi:hypothetical protein AWZ03_014787 [Drosophila navojoa]|uniref:Reverse transcriptase RNase H-like domain-containing protein n=1 Tax=Drosophila navojoa TaxID=7232 RepID=A0A484ART9_DRONA|nr:hypothetical protein AWZ03_014787 [Drosophila navojoa]
MRPTDTRPGNPFGTQVPEPWVERQSLEHAASTTTPPTEVIRRIIAQDSGFGFDPRQVCYRCAQVGLFARECRNAKVLFCRWTEEQEDALQKLKESLTTAPVLACPDFLERLVLQTDASDCGLGAVLIQEIEEQERVIAYASRRLIKAEMNYLATEKECLAIVWAIRKMRRYLEGYRFDVVTDHLALKWLKSMESPTGRIPRWALELQQYQFDVHYHRGNLNMVADTLCRQPLESFQQAVEVCPPLNG